MYTHLESLWKSTFCSYIFQVESVVTFSIKDMLTRNYFESNVKLYMHILDRYLIHFFYSLQNNTLPS